MPSDAVHIRQSVVATEELARGFGGVQSILSIAVAVHDAHGVRVIPPEFRTDFFPNNAVLNGMLHIHGTPHVQEAHVHSFGVLSGDIKWRRPCPSFVDAKRTVGHNRLRLDARTGSIDAPVLGA